MGDLFGPYRLTKRLGSGGMGEVWEASDAGHGGRSVALKVLLRLGGDDDGVDEEVQARFRRECALATRLNSPHIVPIHAYGEIGGRQFIAMARLHGTDLGTLIRVHGPLPPPRAVAIVGQVARALSVAHRAGMVHRDVKPSNVMVTDDGDGGDHVYLIDFGIAWAATATRITSTGLGPGTLAYMAPEQHDGRPVDHRADVYALACVLFETLTGQRPFRGDHAGQLIYAHMSSDPPLASRHRPDVPATLDTVVQRGMAKDPADRYPDAAKLAVAAHAALATDRARQNAKRLLDRARAMSSSARWAEALEVCQQLLDRYGDDRDPAIRDAVTAAMFKKCDALVELDRLAEQLEAFQQVLDRVGADPDPRIRDTIARVLHNRTAAIKRLGWPPEQQLEAFQRVLDYGGADADPSPAVRDAVAKALCNKGYVLAKLGVPAELRLDVFREVVDRFGTATNASASLRSSIAYALLNMAADLRELSRHAERLEALEQLLDRYETDPDPGLRDVVAEAVHGRALALLALGRSADALAALQKFLARRVADLDPALPPPSIVASAMLTKGVALYDLGRLEEALKAYAELIERCGAAPHPSRNLRDSVAAALFNSGLASNRLGRPSEALEAFDLILDRHGADPDPSPQLHRTIDAARREKGVVLKSLGRAEDQSR